MIKYIIFAGATLTSVTTCFAKDVLLIKNKKPNIIMVFTDDLGYGDISYFSPESKIRTQNLDKLAKNGITFTDAHSVSSVSTPSRYGLMTGEYSWKSRLKAGVLAGYSQTLIRKEQPTMASMLKSSGYNTACIGKWHMGMDFQTKDGKPLTQYQEHSGENVDYTKPIKNSPITHGFDYFYGIAGSLDMPPYLMIENDTLVRQPNCKLTVKQFTSNDDDISENPFLRPGDAIFGEGPETFLPRLAKKVENKVSEYSKDDKPFFIYYAMPSPHAPIAPSAKFKGKSNIGAYGDYVMEIDYYVGELIKTLKKTHQYKNTIIAFSSDNGPEYYAYSRYLRTGHRSSGIYKGIKRDLWEGGHRVPLIISWPSKFRKNKKVSSAVCLSDIYSTFAAVVGHKMTSSEAADSYSMLPLITGKGDYQRNYVLHHSCDGKFAIRKGDWILIEDGLGDSNHKFTNADFPALKYYDKDKYKIPHYQPLGQLYNLKKDEQERNNVYAEHPSLVKELDAYIQKATRGYNTKRDQYMKHHEEKKKIW